MKSLRLFAFALGLCALLAALGPRASAACLPFRDGDTVVMLGDSLTAQRLHTEYIEGYLRTRYPGWQLQFHNAGRPGDTVPGVLHRFERDVLRWHPQVVTVELGMNDAYRGLDGVASYLDAMARLVEAIQAAGARPVLLTAGPVNDGVSSFPLSGQNAVLDPMASGVVNLAQTAGVPVADQLHLLLDIWGHNHDSPTGVDLGGDPVHPGPPGHLTKAWACLHGLGAPSLVSAAIIDAARCRVVSAAGCSLSSLNCTTTAVQFVRTDRCLPMPVADAARDGLPLVPLAADLSHYGLKINGLCRGTYDVSIDGIPVATSTAAGLGGGLELGTLPSGPLHDQCQRVLALIAAEQAAAAGRGAALLPRSATGLTAAVQPRPHRFSIVRRPPTVPTVTSWSPRGSSVAPGAPVVLQFNVPMHHFSVERSFGVTPATTGTFQWSGMRLQFTPAAPWVCPRKYRITLCGTARSVEGANLASTFTWTFATAASAPARAAVSMACAPTAAGAQITLHLTAAADVKVCIRNLAGRAVALLQPGQLNAGAHTVLWSGKSTAGTQAPAGTYLIEATARGEDGTSASAVSSLRR